MRLLDQARAFLEAAARPVEHGFDLDEACGEGLFSHCLSFVPPLAFFIARACAEAILLSAGGADRIGSVVGPLSTIRVSGSPGGRTDADLRMVAAGLVEQARLGIWLRGAGPPNRASIACCWASPGVSAAVPGDRRRQAIVRRNDQRRVARHRRIRPGVGFPAPECTTQPLARQRGNEQDGGKVYACSVVSLGRSLRLRKARSNRMTTRNANRRVADIEYQKGTEVAKMQVGEVDDIAVPHPVEDVAERSAEHHSERNLVDPLLLAADPHGDGDGDGRGQRDQHPAPDRGRRVEQAERNAVVLGVGEVEERQQHQLIAELVDAERPGHATWSAGRARTRQRDREAEIRAFIAEFPITRSCGRRPFDDAHEAPNGSLIHVPHVGQDLSIHHLFAPVAQLAVALHLRQVAPAAPAFVVARLRHSALIAFVNCRDDEQLGQFLGRRRAAPAA